MTPTSMIFLICFFFIIFLIFSAFFKYLDYLKFKKRLMSNNIEYENRIEELKTELKKIERKFKISSCIYHNLKLVQS